MAAGNKDRDQQILNRLANLQHKVDSIEQTNAFALRADSERHLDSVRSIFKRSKRKAQVYLATNGDRTVKDIADFLKMKSPNVSRHLSQLIDEGLIEISESSGGSHYYIKTPLDRSIRISQFLQKDYNLSSDGCEL